MRHWVTRVLVLLFAVAWFGVVVPGHERGVVSLVGSGSTVSNQATLPPCHQKRLPASPDDSPPRPGKCLICMLAAMITPPPAMDDCPQLVCRGSIAIASPCSAFAPHVVLPVTERGPPQA